MVSLDIKEITDAWFDSYFAKDEQKKLAKERLEVCKECPSLKNKFQILGKKLQITVCNECGCPINKKIFSNKFNACPLKKWELVDSNNMVVFETKKKALI